MPTLSKDLRNTLAKVTLAAREAAECACRASLENLAVHEKDYRPHMSVEQRLLRSQLRARGRALGDTRDERSGAQEIRRLAEAAAYEHWHRFLFTRFLADNHLLHTDAEHGHVPVTLQECDELAPELNARDGFDLACRFAAKTLPGVFRSDDPVLQLRLALNDEVELKKLLDSLPHEVFTATDALGWTYQFWQEKRKEEVNKSGKKIGADELPAVTQLFTEDYMVEFLLHNTIGAWWAGRRGEVISDQFSVISCHTEADARRVASLPPKDGLPGIDWTYLRFTRNSSLITDPCPLITDNSPLPDDPSPLITDHWSPASGTFPGWPKTAKEIKFLDPCMGSGHFVVFALPLLARMRMEEEGLSAAQAIYAALRDNVFGLELDERCAQIAAFNLALTAWKLGGYQPLPPLHLACSGLAPHATEKDWVAMAGDNDRLQRGMARIYALFKDAPVLGSLINPRALSGDLVEADFHELRPLLETALAQEAKDDNSHDLSADVSAVGLAKVEALAKVEMAVTARGLAKAAEILAGQFILVATNVPYLGRGKQDDVLKGYCDRVHPEAKADLATCFVERCLEFCQRIGAVPAPSERHRGGTPRLLCGATALVTPQNWLFLGSYRTFRQRLLVEASWDCVVRLGENGFESQTAAGAFVAFVTLTRCPPSKAQALACLDASGPATPVGKASLVASVSMTKVSQMGQLTNADARIVLEEKSFGVDSMLSSFATSSHGLGTFDSERFNQYFWEESVISNGWVAEQSAPSAGKHFSGCDLILRWQAGSGELASLMQLKETQGYSSGKWKAGTSVWGRSGVLVSLMRSMPSSFYLGGAFDPNSAAIVPKDSEALGAIYEFCRSGALHDQVRKLHSAIYVPPHTFLKVPFDLAHWQKVAAEKHPHGLPKPFSNDPTQWLFNGHPAGADQPLHVAVVRLLGYRWPRQTGSSFPDCPALDPDGLETLADEDGIVCLPPINREQPAAHRLRALLVLALGQFDERTLVASAGVKGSKSTTLEDWLRDEFFEQHCEMFHQRPFIWHIWDGRKDGFHALVNYHKLDNATLQKLTYSYLGDWIRHQEEDAKAGKPGADARLGAARALQTELAKILEGEAPYDIFVRWKPLATQAMGWHPDLNDGVRLNIRPFMSATDVGKKGAGILRSKPGIKWDKDRGKEPQREKEEYPWFWCEEEPGADPEPGKEFTGHRWNDVHWTLEQKAKAKGGN